MRINAHNLKLRRLPASQWMDVKDELQALVSSLNGVEIVEIEPGIVRFSIDGRNGGEQSRLIAQLISTLPKGWNVSEESQYELTKTFGSRVL